MRLIARGKAAGLFKLRMGAHLLAAEECGFHQKIDISLDRLEIEEPFLDRDGHGQALFLERPQHTQDWDND